MDPQPRPLVRSEDWRAVLLGGLILAVVLVANFFSRPADYAQLVEKIGAVQDSLATLEANPPAEGEVEARKSVLKGHAEEIEKTSAKLHSNPFKAWTAKIDSWKSDPRDAFFKKKKVKTDEGTTVERTPLIRGIAGACLAGLIVFGLGAVLAGESVSKFFAAFFVVFALAVASYVLAGQEVIKYYNLEYALWAIVLGMLIANTLGTPEFLKPALKTELFIKTGLILLGAEILLSRLLVLGLPGIFVSWVVTPITLITTYAFGQYVLRMPSRSLNMVISADMSVCGVSAAIATAAACRAKKEELSLAIGLSLAFTVVMMIVMPLFIRAVGMNDVLGGAWLGGTIDSTGAVAAAGGMLSQTALEVASTVKMIQNILIGVVGFGVAVYWVTCVEKVQDGKRPGVSEIWLRFPKFVLGFVGASVVFSWIYASGVGGKSLAESAMGTTEILRGWFFCLAFVSIGLESNFRELAEHMKGGKPLVLYVCGQALNLALTLLMAWIMFEKVFPGAAAALGK